MGQTNPTRGSSRLKLVGAGLILVALTVAAGWGIYAVPAPMVDRMLEADLRKSAMRLSRQVESNLNSLEATFRHHSLTPHDQDFLNLLSETSDIYRFKLFDASG